MSAARQRYRRGSFVTDEYKTDKEYANFLSETLRVLGPKQQNDTDRTTVVLCAGYLRGLAGSYEQLEREVVECKRLIAMDTVTVNELVNANDKLRFENTAVLNANKLLVDRDTAFLNLFRVTESYLVDVKLQYGDQWNGGLGELIKSIRQVLDAAK